MTNLYFSSKEFIKLVSDHSEILSLIDSISKIKNSLTANTKSILDTPNSQPQQLAAFQKLFQRATQINNELLQKLRTVRPIDLYEKINLLITSLNLFDSKFNDKHTLINELKKLYELHTDAYSEKGKDQIWNFSNSCNNIHISIEELKDKAEYIISEHSKSQKPVPKNYFELRIGTDQDVPVLNDFVMIFNSIEDLYKFLCIVHKEDYENNRLILNQLNTGSWYTEILGIKQVVISIENIIKDIGSFFRSYLVGDIDRERFVNDCMKVEAVMDLIVKAEENGIDNVEVGLKKAIIPLIDNLSSGTTILNVNEEEVLKLQKTERLTLLSKETERTKLLKTLNLSLEQPKPDKKEKK